MSLNSIVVQGTLKPDGTLELDEKPTLAPGRVHVMLQACFGRFSSRRVVWPRRSRRSVRTSKLAAIWDAHPRRLPATRTSVGQTRTHTNNECRRFGRKPKPAHRPEDPNARLP